MSVQRPSGRHAEELRQVIIQPHVSRYAEGSCLVKFGNTHVLCTASVEESLPPFIKRGSGQGWVTAEYSMLPRSTHSRTRREATQGKQSGRTMEIQRLIGRSLRAVTKLSAMGERQVTVDCDVIQADGGTRTASITGGFVALHLAFQQLVKKGALRDVPLNGQVAAISCGVYHGAPVLDLEYEEDSAAAVDANFVMTGDGRLVEIQGTGEEHPFTEEQFLEMLRLAKLGVGELVAKQRQALGV